MAEGYIYTRKSRAPDGREEEAGVLSHQREALLLLAGRHGLSIRPENIVEEIGSGESLAGRPRLKGLLERWEREPPSPGSALLVTAIDRLGRGDEEEMAPIIGTLRRVGVTLLTLDQRFALDVPSDKLLYRVLMAVSGHQLDRNKEDVRLRKNQLTRQNLLVTGKAPYGYTWDKNGDGEMVNGQHRGCLRADPVRFPLVQSLCRDALTMSVEALGAKYRMHPSTVCWNLRNPILCGYAVRRFTLHKGEKPWSKQKSVKIPRDQWVWPEEPGAWPVACTRPEWEAIQDAMDRRGTLKGRTDFVGNGWCRDALAFVGFPRPVRLSSLGRHGREPRPIYEKVVPGLPNLYVYRKPVHDFVEDHLLPLLGNVDLVLTALADYHRRVSEQAARVDRDEPARLRQKIERNRKQLDDLLRRELAADPEEAASIARVRETIKAEITRLTQELSAVRPPVENLPALDMLAGDLPEILAGQLEDWEAMEGAAHRSIVNACIEQVPVEIRFRQAGERSHQRRFLPIVYQPWLARHLR